MIATYSHSNLPPSLRDTAVVIHPNCHNTRLLVDRPQSPDTLLLCVHCTSWLYRRITTYTRDGFSLGEEEKHSEPETFDWSAVV